MNTAETVEIERKFLVSRIPPEVQHGTGVLIEQGYLAVSADGTEIRLRRKGERFFQTLKKGRGLVRTEVQIELTGDQFAALWPMTEGRRVSKHRYNLPVDGYVCELDVFLEPLQGLVIAEVEFPSIEESRQFAPPDWFAGDVTEDRRFKNQHLALHGMPAGFSQTGSETRW